MILATHALTGAVIGKNFSNPWIIIIASLIIHFIMDTFRHGEYLNQKSGVKEVLGKVIIDVLAGITIIILIASWKNFSAEVIKNMLIGAFFSMFPDLLTFLYWKGHIKFLKKIYEFHNWVHKYPRFSPESDWNFRNAVNDIIISAIAILLLIF
jgi:hypothetical protein